MPIQNKAGTPSRRLFDPKAQYGAADARGLYGWSLFEARLSYIGEGVVSDTTANNGNPVNLLLFTCDVPIICKIITNKTGTTSPYFSDVQNSTDSGGSLLTTASGGGANASVPTVGTVAKGFTGVAGAVPCSGFLTAAEVLVNGGGVSVASAIDLQVWANSGGMIGPISPNDHANGSTEVGAPQPIILYYAQYTEAMRAAGNTFTLGGLYWLVVGLHDLPFPV
jgi:hypothetical protein